MCSDSFIGTVLHKLVDADFADVNDITVNGATSPAFAGDLLGGVL